MIIYIKTITVKYLYLKWIQHGKEKNVLLKVSLKFESDIFNYLFVHLIYHKDKKIVTTEYDLNMPVPREIEESISRMRYTTNAVEKMYVYLWNDIKKKNYITFE